MEELACFNEVIDYTSDKCILSGRCNHAGQAFTEEPDQGILTFPSVWGIEFAATKSPAFSKRRLKGAERGGWESCPLSLFFQQATIWKTVLEREGLQHM